MTDCKQTTDPADDDAEQAAHLQWLAEFDRWEALTPRQREDEIRRAM